MIQDRDLYLAKAEMKRRQEWADEERLARQARRQQAEHQAERSDDEAPAQGAFNWLRRLAGAR